MPDAGTAIQVCYDLDNTAGTFVREVKALLKITEVLECQLFVNHHTGYGTDVGYKWQKD